MRFSTILLTALMVGATSVSLQPAVAAPLSIDRSLAAPAATLQPVQYWRHHHHGWRRGYYGYGPGYYGYGYGPGAVVGGLAAGAIVGSAIAGSAVAGSQTRAAGDDSYCFRRFKSYDPASGTYLGYDGDRHPCP